MRPRVDVVIPVLNETRRLQRGVETLHAFLSSSRGRYDWRMIIADNGSTDGTGAMARELAQRLPNVSYRWIAAPGRGRAVREAWTASDADICAYMDVDLSSDLRAFPDLLDAIAVKGCDLAIGSRLAPGARITRSLKREVLSRGYNILVKLLFASRFADGQCGFKAIRRAVAQRLLPHVRNQRWFFDTELLLIAERYGYSIAEIPLQWIEDRRTRVKILPTVVEDVRGLLRVRFTRFPPSP